MNHIKNPTFAVMKINFFKYQGAGNDFVLVDNRANKYQLTTAQIKFLCDRRFGIGADGLMLLQSKEGYDFEMVYFNADGNESTMCGNGGRCIAAFAYFLGLAQKELYFIAVDGAHRAKILAEDMVSLEMIDVDKIDIQSDACILNTGSPHYVQFVPEITNLDVFTLGKTIRNQEVFAPKGINVNFAQVIDNNTIAIRTYERGVEDETLACGTGVTAAAIASACNETGKITKTVHARGGTLQVSFEKIDQQSIKNIWLTGPARLVYEGTINI
jgi:diaminopimelate epimerase